MFLECDGTGTKACCGKLVKRECPVCQLWCRLSQQQEDPRGEQNKSKHEQRFLMSIHHLVTLTLQTIIATEHLLSSRLLCRSRLPRSISSRALVVRAREPSGQEWHLNQGRMASTHLRPLMTRVSASLPAAVRRGVPSAAFHVTPPAFAAGQGRAGKGGQGVSEPLLDYYKILGVDPSASHDEIKEAFRLLGEARRITTAWLALTAALSTLCYSAKEHHPDMGNATSVSILACLGARCIATRHRPARDATGPGLLQSHC